MLNNFYNFFQYSNNNNLSFFINLVSNSLEKIFNSIDKNNYPFIKNIELNDNILTIDLNNDKTYILNINKINKQLWLSSPFSGPKRFEYDKKTNQWLDINNYKINLYKILNNEFNNLIKQNKLISYKKLNLI
jgi:frataxin